MVTRESQPLSWAAKRKTVTAAGTAEQLADTEVGHNQRLIVRALAANTGNVFLGASQTAAETATTRVTLAAGESATLHVANANLVWVDAAVNGEGVDYHVG